MAKRRLISLLPSFQQTDDLRNFFGSTVDQVFQPGRSQSITGYIGRRSDTDTHDFYIGEPTASRAAYQLESAMVSYTAVGNLADVLSYPDFIGYLETHGADVSDHQRLFDTEYYSWAPPVNIDMLVNYRNYYWFGDDNGAVDLPILVLTVPYSQVKGDGHTLTFDLPVSINAVRDEVPAVYVNNMPVSFTVVGDTIVLEEAPPSGSDVLFARVPDFAAAIADMMTAVDVSDLNTHNVSVLTSGMRIQIIDLIHIIGAWDAQPWDYNLWDLSGSRIYMVDGVGQSLRLTSDDDLIRDRILKPQYVTIDRASRDSNMWSLHNLWVHKDSFAWSDANFLVPLTERQARRPIIEFIRDLVLWQRVDHLQTSAFIGNTTLTFERDMPDLVGRLVTGTHIPRNTTVTSVHRNTVTLSKPLTGNVTGGTEITFTQMWEQSVDPLFMLYDLTGVPLDDLETYPESDFVGSGIFSYSLSNTSPVDPILLRRLAFDQINYILFDNLTVTARYSYLDGAISGLYMYGLDDAAMVYESLWHPVASTTYQGITNGFYDVPLNLQANPASEDVHTISRSTWIDHFRTLIDRQIGFEGQSLGINNYRDTPRDLTVGRNILQHRAPLLKAMLLATDTTYDLPQAIRFADQEYNRFRNKFARKLVELRNDGTLTDTDVPAVWVNTALKAIKRDKNNQFPFALNAIAGDQWFIPPTPTCLGVLSAAKPAMVLDSTYAVPVLMIMGHDGSFTPAFDDWRDPLMLALEQTIFDHLPQAFQTAARPGFDVHQWIGGRFYAPYNGYTRNEVSNMLAPWFELWAQQNRFDYRTNTGFDQSNPFSWNFRDVLDRSGNPLPGNWRAIYRWYFGTDAPHLRPWEMLGFVSEPVWWVATYGPAPYVRSNPMWDDLEHGVIRSDVRAGTDETYARIGLADYIPVDDQGNLLDPIACGIVDNNVTSDTAARSWLVGDHGPVENLWINSPSYRFAMALIGFLMKPARFVEQCWDPIHIGYIGRQWVELATFERPLNANLYLHGELVNDTKLQVIGISQWLDDYLVSSGHTSDILGRTVRGLGVRLIHQMAGFTSNDDMKVIADNFGLVPAEDIDSVLYTSPSTRTEVYSGVILEWTGQSWRAIGYDAGHPFFTIIEPDVHGPKGVISLATTAEPMIVVWHTNTYYPTGILAAHLHTVWECVRTHTSSTVFEQVFWQSRSDLNLDMVRAPRVITYLNGADTVAVPYGTEFHNYQQVADFLLGWQRWLQSRGWIFDTIDSQTGQIRNWSLSVREFLSWAQVQWSPGNFIALSPGQQQLKFSTPTGTILNVESAINGFFGLIDRSGRPIHQRDSIVNRLDGDLTILAKQADIFAARLGLADIEHALVFDNITIFNDNIYLPLFLLRQDRLRLNCKRSTDWTGRLDAPGFVITGNGLSSDFEKAAEDIRLMFDIEKSDRTDLRDYARHVIGFQRRDYLETLLISDIEQFEFYQGMIQQKGAPGVFEKLTRSIRASNNSNLQFLEEWAVRLSDYGAPIDPFMIFQLRQTELRNHPQIVRLVATPDAPLTWIIMPPLDPRWVDPPASTDFFPMRTDYAPPMLPTAGPVRLSDVSATVFHIYDVPDLYFPAIQAEQIPFPTGFLTWVYERADGTYTVLQSFETGFTPNAIRTVLSNDEDETVTTTRIIFQRPITLTPADVGAYLVINGLSLSSPELEGLVLISAVNVLGNWADVEPISDSGYDFAPKPETAPFVRVLREVRFPNRAAVTASGYAFEVDDLVWIDADEDQPTISVSDASLDAYWGTWHEFMADLDGGDEVMGSHTTTVAASMVSLFALGSSVRRWAVLQWTGAIWATVRNQPHRMSPRTISETVIYRAGTKVVDLQMIIDEPVVDEVTVIDPLDDLIAGIAEREIEYEVGYDPARYNAGFTVANNPWGPNEIGQVWWDLAAVKFLDPYTDILDASSERDLAELTYRTAYWAHIAPKTSVDVYEWVESTVDPMSYTGPGTVYNSVAPSWSEHSVYSIQYGRDIIRYYFWVKGLTVKPELPFRHTDITTVAKAIENPSGLDLAWMGAISRDALIISGVSQFLDDTATVMKVQLTVDADSPGRHDEWRLLRPTDETSLPPALIWQKLRDSLSGFDIIGQPVPDPRLNPLRAVGIRQSQGMFVTSSPDGPRGGLLAARQSFVGIVNTILNRAPIWRYRGVIIDMLFHSTLRTLPMAPIDQYLAWSQTDESEIFEPPPRNEWDVQVYSLVERNRLLGRVDFERAMATGKPLRVLLNGIGQPRKQWSIWEFDPAVANRLVGEHPDEPVDEVLIGNADVVFQLATAYDFAVRDRSARNHLSGGGYGIGPYGIGPYSTSGNTVAIGQRVLVIDDTDGFWAIWLFMPSDVTADAQGFVLWRVQSYRTNDFIETIDWYAAGYFASRPPIVIYDTITERNSIEGTSPSNQFVKVLDDGSSNPTPRWIWTQFDVAANQWIVVAMQNGTAKLTDGFYNSNYVVHAVDHWQSLAASAALGATILSFGDTSGFTVGQFVNGPGLDRSTKIIDMDSTKVKLDRGTVAVIPQDTLLTISNLSLADIKTRDGSWEIYVLADALRYGEFLTDAEINEIFFSMLNFVHTQQDSVDWAFKTSFMAIVGYNVPLTQTPVLMSDQTQSLLSYINEVKPYHVKVRGFSTQYNTDIDNAASHIIEDPAFQLTLAFDRYTHSVDGWDMEAWDILLWDGGETSKPAVFVHTVVVDTLLAAAHALHVDDVRFFLNTFDADSTSQPVSETYPLAVRINANVYQVIDVVADVDNISTVKKTVEFVANNAGIDGTVLTVDAIISGTVVVGQILTSEHMAAGTTIIGNLTGDGEAGTYTVSIAQTIPATTIQGSFVTQQGLSGWLFADDVFRVVDGTQGTVVEGIIPMPNASNRITQHYEPSGNMPPDDLTVLLSLDPRPTYMSYVVTAMAKRNVTVLTLAHTDHISVGEPVFGPNIVNGATVTAVSESTVTLSLPITNDLLRGASITVGMPTHISGDILYGNNNAPFYTYDGNAVAVDVSLNPAQTSEPGGYDLRAPYRKSNHPEERIPFNGDDAFCISVNALPIAGAPPQLVKAFDVGSLSGDTTTLYFDMLAQSAAGVMVFRDGIRGELGVDYTVDHFAKTTTVQMSRVGNTNYVQNPRAEGGGPGVVPPNWSIGAEVTDTITFSQTSGVNTITGTADATGTHLVGNNIAVTITQIDAPLAPPIAAFLDISADSVSGATAPPSTNVVQHFAGSFSINSAANGSGTTYMSGLFMDATVGIRDGTSYTLTADGLFASDVIANLSPPRTFTLSFTNVTPAVNTVAQTANSANCDPFMTMGCNDTGATIRSFTASVSGVTFSVRMNSTVIGIGTEAGIPYIDVRFNFAGGKDWSIWVQPFPWSDQPLGLGLPQAIEGEAWTGSSYVRLIDGALVGVAGAADYIDIYDVTGNYISSASAPRLPTAAPLSSQRSGFTATLPANSNIAIYYYYAWGAANGGAVDFTLRFGGPQFQRGDTITSLILPPVGQPGISHDMVHVKRVGIHAFGLGGSSPVTEAYYLAYASNPFRLPVATSQAKVDLTIDGRRLSPAEFAVSGTEITLQASPAVGADMAVVSYQQGVSTATLISMQKLGYEISRKWSLLPHDTFTVPEHAGTIVELNGRRLTPPCTFYGDFTPSKNWMGLWIMPTASTTYTVYVDGVKYTTPIPISTTTNPGSPYPFDLYLPAGAVPPTNVAGRFVFFDHKMVALDPAFTATIVTVVLLNAFPADYTVTNGQLSVNRPLLPDDDLVVTVFSNADTMAMKTVVYPMDLAAYPVPPTMITYPIPTPMIPIDREYTWVSMGGLTLVPDQDYQIRYFDDTAVLDLLIRRTPGYLVITCCTGQLAHETQQWLNVSRTSAKTRMPPVYDASGEPVINDNDIPYHHVLDECLGLSPAMAGKLAVALNPDDDQMVLDLFLRDMSPKLHPQTPLDIPGALPGVLWIGGERIEYFRLSRVGDVVTLSGLRRGTQGTSIAEQRQTITTTGDGVSHTYILEGVGPVEVMADNIQQTFTVEVIDNTTMVTIAAPVDSFVTISISAGYVYSSGTAAYNPTKIACDPVQRLSPSYLVKGEMSGAAGLGLAGNPVGNPSKPITGIGRASGIGAPRRLAAPNGNQGLGRVGVVLGITARAIGVTSTGQVGTPSLPPSLALNFTTPETLDSRIVFSRASAATYFDNAGVMRTAATNLVFPSVIDVANWTGGSITITANASIAPDGTTTAARVSELASNALHYIIRNPVSTPSTGMHTISMYAKAMESRYLQISLDDSGSGTVGGYATFDVQAGVVSGPLTARGGATIGTAGIEPAANGFYRCWLSTTFAGTPTARLLVMLVNTANPPTQPAYPGNAANGLLVWGAQLETGAAPTFYVPTTTVANNAPRWDYDPASKVLKGLLLEEARTNIITTSNNVSGPDWNQVALTATGTAGIAPDGTNTMTRIADTAATGAHYIQVLKTTTALVPYTSSIFAKAQQNRYLQLFVDTGGGATGYATFDLQTGVISGPYAGNPGGTAAMQAVGNGIYRCSVTNNIGAVTGMRAGFLVAQTANPSFAPGYTGNTANGLLVWGAQLEQGAFATSYIPTTNSAVTRAADSCRVPVGSWYNTTKGSMSIEYIVEGASGTYGAPAQLIGSDGNIDFINVDEQSVQTTPGVPVCAGAGIMAAGASIAWGSFATPFPAVPLGVAHKGASSWALNNPVRVTHNGFVGGTQVGTCTSLPVVVNMTIAGPMHYQTQNSLWVRNFNYWPRVLPDAEMVTVTQLDPITFNFMAP